jgi:hypothetical protein
MPIVLPFLRQMGEDMKLDNRTEPRNEESKNRSIALPVYLWEALDGDAKRCRRSAVKQIEAILVRYYRLEASVDLDERAIAEAHSLVSDQRKTA